MEIQQVNKKLVETVTNGHLISPILPKQIKNYLIDIVETIFRDIPNEEPERMLTAKVYPEALTIINKWFDQGHVIPI